MCSLNKKLTLFDYMVGEFVKWHKEKVCCSDISDNEVLKTLKLTRCMKLLYFTCLASVGKDNGNYKGLFRTFNTFLAYQRGPVEENVYNNRKFLFRYRFDGEFLQKRENPLGEILPNSNLEEYNQEKKLIDKAIGDLKNIPKFPMNDTDALVDLSHNLKLWKESIAFSYPLLPTRFESELKREKELFDKKCANL